MDLFEPALVILLLLFGLIELVAAFAAARMPLRVLGLPKRRAGELAEGRALIHGELVAESSMPRTLDGLDAVAVESRLLGADKWEGVRSAQVWADLAVADQSGTCAVDLDGVLLLGESRHHTVPAARVAAECPTLWDKCNDREKTWPSMRIEQRFVRSGSGLVAGEVSTGPRSGGEGYREGPRARLVLASGMGLPLVVTHLSKNAVARHLLGPALLHAATALLALALAAGIFSVDRFVYLTAGIDAFWP